MHSLASTLEHCIIPCVQKAFVLDTDVTWEGSTQVCVLEECERENFGQKTTAIHHEGYGPPVLGHGEELKPACKEMITYWFGMSRYTFFYWPGEILHLPGPAIKMFRDCFSLLYQSLWSQRQCLDVQTNVSGKSQFVHCCRNLFFWEFFPSVSLYSWFRAELLEWPEAVYSLF